MASGLLRSHKRPGPRSEPNWQSEGATTGVPRQSAHVPLSCSVNPMTMSPQKHGLSANGGEAFSPMRPGIDLYAPHSQTTISAHT